MLWLDGASSCRNHPGSFSHKVVTLSKGMEGGGTNGVSELKIQTAKPDVMQRPEKWSGGLSNWVH